jgi:hypothetical protein
MLGRQKLKQFHMVNTNMFRHPKYYKELRKRNKPAGTGGALCVDPEAGSDQVISLTLADGCNGGVHLVRAFKPQATSFKHQAPEATSHKHQAPSTKAQASSHKLQAPRLLTLEKVSRHPNRGAGPR